MGGTAEVAARLTAGFDSIGAPRTIADPALRIMDRTIQPTGAAGEGERLYEATWNVDPGEVLGPVTVDPPRVAGAPAPAGPVWFGMRRVGSDTLRIDAGEDLSLEVEVG